jgi:hypothetical protein
MDTPNGSSTPTSSGPVTYTVFLGTRRVGAGDLAHAVRAAVAAHAERGHDEPVWVFDDRTGMQLELDWRGTHAQVLARARAAAGAPEPPAASVTASRSPGRPKLGVVAREVTLLPRHWEWLATQPAGASATLRRLVDEARRRHAPHDTVRQAQDRCYRFLQATAGDLPGYEEALRMLYAGNSDGFDAAAAGWPRDLGDYARALAAAALQRA